MKNTEVIKKLRKHTYTIVFFENGRFCWKNKRWVKRDGMGKLTTLRIMVNALIPFTLGWVMGFLGTQFLQMVLLILNIFCCWLCG